MKGWGTGFALAAMLCIASVACSGGGGKNSRGKGPECPEIFAYGFRNPWRMNFDPVTAKLYVGDVGQAQKEEIDIVVSGGNFGWDCREGDVAHAPTTAACTGPFEDPEVVHDRSEAQAITGGVVYRGSISAFYGQYFYGDFQSGLFFTFDADVAGSAAERLTALPSLNVSAFGQARNGDIYAVVFDSPSIRKFVSTGSGVQAVGFENAFSSRSFNQPVKLVQHPTDANRWYVVEQDGFVQTFLSTNSTAATEAADVDARVGLGGSLEQGLLGMAFDPDFATTGDVYFAYTNDSAGTVELARWRSTNGGLTFTPTVTPVVLSIPHPDNNHNGSDIMFGPDGFLYYSMGDGGGADDPSDNGQAKDTLLGKILRIDVNSSSLEGKAYAIPPSNPYAGNKLCDGTSR